MAGLSVLLAGAIFGFFYAWVCSTIWGLDAADPRTAIDAMQAMNASVRNAVFFPAFFLTPVALMTTAALARASGQRRAAGLLAVAAAVYVVGAFLVTMAVNVPMNDQLAAVVVPNSVDAAATIWSDYSIPWQRWNVVRTIAGAITLLLAARGFAGLDR